MNSAAFLIMNAKINGQIRNEAKRVANCETNNIDKAVNASIKHITAIKALDDAGLLSSLPEELENTARLRLKYSDLSLSQLAQMSVPPISKPGLSHRLKKIMEIAEQKIGKKF
jgi:DNA-binding protein WhiA